MIATVVPARAHDFVTTLAAEGIEAAVVGELTEVGSGRVLVRDGVEEPLTHPGLDPFWAAFGAWATGP